MAQSRCRSVGIDPAFVIDKEIDCALRAVPHDQRRILHPARPVGTDRRAAVRLAFIDGMHLFEFALRDFINTERHCSPKAVIVFDDILPRNCR